MPSKTIKGSPYSFYAFYSLYKYFHPRPFPQKFALDEIASRLYPGVHIDQQEPVSLFITWKKKNLRDNEYYLRGCIGTFAKFPLVFAIERYALIAAFEDNRFPPIEEREFSRLHCSCNILQNFKTIYSKKDKGDIFDWEIGVHGIELRFQEPRSGEVQSATFLPEVMVEQNWSKRETYSNLIEKAGCYMDIDEIMDHYEEYFLEVVRYEGNKSELAYEDFERGLKELVNGE